VRTDQQEADVVESRSVLVVMAGVIVATVIGVWIAWLLLGRGEEQVEGARRGAGIPPEVSAMETGTFSDRAQGLETHQAAERWLSAYGWVDRDRGLVHIPIETAMKLYLERQGGGR